MVESSPATLDLVFQALADPTRRSILREVARHEHTVSELAKPFRMSLAAVSKHLKILDRARLIRREKRGSFQFIRLNSEAMMPADEWLAWYRQFWSANLDSLKDFLENQPT